MKTLLNRLGYSGWLHILLLPSWVLSSPNHTIPLPECQRRVGLFLMCSIAFSSCKECLWTPNHPPCAHFPNPLPYGYAVSISISIMEAVKKGMQYNLLLDSGIQFVPCSPFTVLECIPSTSYWREMNRYPCRFTQWLLVQFHSTQSNRGASCFLFVFITGVRTLI